MNASSLVTERLIEDVGVLADKILRGFKAKQAKVPRRCFSNIRELFKLLEVGTGYLGEPVKIFRAAWFWQFYLTSLLLRHTSLLLQIRSAMVLGLGLDWKPFH